MCVTFTVEKAFVIDAVEVQSIDKEVRFFTQGELLLHSTVAQKEGLKNNTKSSTLMA